SFIFCHSLSVLVTIVFIVPALLFFKTIKDVATKIIVIKKTKYFNFLTIRLYKNTFNTLKYCIFESCT
ncbi:hypothetical protein NQU49_28450, partial [Escherichia coli]|uniref:hypothetical protein n=1 Tax=Escherichia coli TaxID=562 RepID=UPI002118D2AD